MLQKRNPAPLAGGNRAGVLQAGHAVGTRETLRNQAALRLRRQHLVEVLHGLGARATFEFVDEIAGNFGIEQHLDDRLEAYTTRLSPGLLQLTGGDHFAPSPMRVIGGSQ